MDGFKDFIELQEDTEFHRKPWKASKHRIMQYWTALRGDLPIQLRPIPLTHKGSTYDQDGIRITGSAAFITAILSRLKELLNYDSPQAKLDLVYRETEASARLPYGGSSYAFYLNLREKKPKT